MVVDTSALVAIVFGEPDAERLSQLIVAAGAPILVSAATLVEAGIVVEARQGPDASRDLDVLLQLTGSQVVPVDEPLARAAVSAWRRFGKGRHPAGLNYGDCFSYALAATTGEPLLCTGIDFAQTDVLIFRT